MSYKIDNVAIGAYGFAAGWIGGSPCGYALQGVWNLPKRVNKTYYDWGVCGNPSGSIEPYVEASDIVFERRDFSLSIIARAESLIQFRECVEALYIAIGNSFTVSHSQIGNYEVVLTQCDVTSYSNGWGQATLKLKEMNPLKLTDLKVLLPAGKPATTGIDGYSWAELGLVVGALDNRYDLPSFQPLELTEQSHSYGSRSAKTIMLQGTLIAIDYADFKAKTELWQAIIGRDGTRTVRHIDGSTRTCFCVDGVTITDVIKFGSGVHWAKFNCKMIEL